MIRNANRKRTRTVGTSIDRYYGTSKLEQFQVVPYHCRAGRTDELLIMLENHHMLCYRNVGEALSFLLQHEGEDHFIIDWTLDTFLLRMIVIT